jgi:ubiquinone/menaquinone biosynthesis C-methylase UbiE
MTGSAESEAVARVVRVFEAAADDYDQSGVAWFGPIADRLCALLEPAPGERAVDLGCGRGAVTIPLAEAVGQTGSVTAVDAAPTMVAHARDAAARAGLTQVRTAVVDASAPDLPAGAFDLAAASAVLFFLPEPAAAVRRWLGLLRPGGRLGITTFGALDPRWAQVDALFKPYLPPQLRDPRTTSADSPLASDEGVAALVRGAGGVDVRTVTERLAARFADAQQWRAWTMGTGQRAFWGFVPEQRREPLFEEATAILDRTRGRAGALELYQDVRYTLCRVPSSDAAGVAG